MNQMWHVRGSQSPFPYAIFITKFFEHFGVLLEGETKVALNRLESKVDIEVVHKMGFVIDPVTRRTYKHRTDRQPAPTDEPEPTAHNSKRKGEHTCIHIGGAYSRQIKIYHQIFNYSLFTAKMQFTNYTSESDSAFSCCHNG
ncbi:hypothetical protein Lal_00043418 [Lupinus albus]|nr:hypothetical protein Lal_00043418 [Lupinus albus]